MVTQRRIPRVDVTGLVAFGLGATFQAVDVLVELCAETAQVVTTRTRAVVRLVDQNYREAGTRGDVRIRKAAADAREEVDQVVGVAVGWVDQQIVRRMVESMKPYLIDELIPEVLDGVLPKIRADVVPVLIDDLAHDERVQSMVAAQSRDVLSRGVSGIRNVSEEADEQVEASLHRLFGRQGPEA